MRTNGLVGASLDDAVIPGALVMEPRESWARSSFPSGPTHRDSRTREDRHLHQYDGLPSRHSRRRLFRRLLKGAASLHGSRGP